MSNIMSVSRGLKWDYSSLIFPNPINDQFTICILITNFHHYCNCYKNRFQVSKFLLNHRIKSDGTTRIRCHRLQGWAQAPALSLTGHYSSLPMLNQAAGPFPWTPPTRREQPTVSPVLQGIGHRGNTQGEKTVGHVPSWEDLRGQSRTSSVEWYQIGCRLEPWPSFILHEVRKHFVRPVDVFIKFYCFERVWWGALGLEFSSEGNNLIVKYLLY